jgi:hypothetical protein
MHLFSIIIVSLSLLTGGAQNVTVKAKFQIDGKETKDKFRIILYADGVATETTISDDGTFPVPALNVPKVNVRFLSGQYDLLYEDVYVVKLRGTLTFGVTKTLPGHQALCKRGRRLVSSHSLEFDPGDGDGTAMTVTVCK